VTGSTPRRTAERLLTIGAMRRRSFAQRAKTTVSAPATDSQTASGRLSEVAIGAQRLHARGQIALRRALTFANDAF
jgi:hypothetical protein